MLSEIPQEVSPRRSRGLVAGEKPRLSFNSLNQSSLHNARILAGPNSLEAASNESIGINRNVGIPSIDSKDLSTGELVTRSTGSRTNKKDDAQIQVGLSSVLVEHFARNQPDQGTQPRQL